MRMGNEVRECLRVSEAARVAEVVVAGYGA
jgi:hypothetical protein